VAQALKLFTIQALFIALAFANMVGGCSGAECMRPASPLIEQEEPSGMSFVLIFWRPSCLSSGVLSRQSLQLIKIHELLFIALFKFRGYYLNSWHYSKYSLLFKFGI
jgi:hypothetical protein